MTSSDASGDADRDGLRDNVETNTGIFLSATDTGTNPYVSDTDGDSMPDGMELSLGSNPVNNGSKVKRPNIIYIMADDLAYGELGCFGQNQRTGIWKIETPGLDSMAAEGVMMTHHYASAPLCVSSRCSLLEGRSQGHASIRDGQFDFPIPTGHLLADALKKAGYKTVHIGKAGLTGKDQFNPVAHPMDRGFDSFFGILTHGECHEHYPRNGTTESKTTIYSDRLAVSGAHIDLYTSDAWTGYAKKTIIEETNGNPDRPFFIYLAYDTPHFWGTNPPTKSYPAGLGLNGGIQWTGAPSFINTATNDPARVNNPANTHSSVSSLWYPDAQKYVTMIRRLDDSVADILKTLKDLGVANDTLVVFSSDNGASQIGYDPRSFGGYGNFEGIKGDLLEGGIRVPTIAWWPDTIPATKQVSNIRKIDRPSANYDWLATFTAAAKVPIPAYTDGTSLLPSLTGVGTQSDRGFLYFEMYTWGNTPDYPEFPYNRNRVRGNMQAIRIGDFMGLRTGITTADQPFMIYNVVNDPKQSINLASSMPVLQNEMSRLSVGARRQISTTTRPYDSAKIPAFTPNTPVRNGLKWKSYEGYWPWLPDFRTLTPSASGEALNITTTVKSRDTDVGLFFEGYLSISTAGTYAFQTESSAESSLWIHESHVIDNDFAYTAIKTSGTVNLNPGLHPFRLYFRHRCGTPSLTLRYSGPGISMQTVPPSMIFQDGQPTILTPDSFLINRTQSPLIDVLSNDTSELPLSLVGAGTARFGRSSVSSGRILYQPSPGFIGFDGFTYEANDSLSSKYGTVSGTVLYDNEVWFPLDEGQGTLVTQASGLGTGAITGSGTPTSGWTTGRTGRAFRFDGIDRQITLSGLAFPTGAAPRTFSCWMRTTDAGLGEAQALFSQGSGGLGQRFTVRLARIPGIATSQSVRLETDGGVYSGIKKVNDGLWHHVAVSVADRNNNGVITIDETRIYIDGILDEGRQDAFGTVITSSSGAAPTLGGAAHDPGFNFKGDLDDVRFFARSIDSTEAQFLFANPPKAPNYSESTAGPPGDNDGDGFSDVKELIAGTDLDDASSFPRIKSIAAIPGGYQVYWNGVAGRKYTIVESENLINWVPSPGVPPVLVAVDSNTTAALIPAGDKSARFFKLAIEDLSPTPQQSALPQGSSDYDGDGASDSDEFIAGTDPLDPFSTLRLKTELLSSNQINITWDAQAGRTYRLYQSQDLATWSPVPAMDATVVASDQSNFSRALPANAWTKRFIRLGVTITP